MNTIDSIEALLVRLTRPLNRTSHCDWANSLERLSEDLAEHPKEVAREILSLYGGMGSFNDLVLYDRGVLLKEQNIELDELRAALFRQCQDLL